MIHSIIYLQSKNLVNELDLLILLLWKKNPKKNLDCLTDLMD